MKEVTSYKLYFYGGPNGYQTNRGQIQLFGKNGDLVGYVRFNDPEMFYEDDSQGGGVIRMHLPSSMYLPVLDMLRNEKPVYMYFSMGRGFLATSQEPVGEDD